MCFEDSDIDSMSMADLAQRALGKFTKTVRSATRDLSDMTGDGKLTSFRVPNGGDHATVLGIDRENYDLRNKDLAATIPSDDSVRLLQRETTEMVYDNPVATMDTGERSPPSHEEISEKRSLGDEARGPIPSPKVLQPSKNDDLGLPSSHENALNCPTLTVSCQGDIPLKQRAWHRIFSGLGGANSESRSSEFCNLHDLSNGLNSESPPLVHGSVDTHIALVAPNNTCQGFTCQTDDAFLPLPHKSSAASVQPPSCSDHQSSFVAGLTRLLVGPSWLDVVADTASGAVEDMRSPRRQSTGRHVGRSQVLQEHLHRREIAEMDAKHVAMKKELICQSLRAVLSLPTVLRKVPREKVAKAFANDITETRQRPIVAHMPASDRSRRAILRNDIDRTIDRLIEVRSRLKAIRNLAVGSSAATKPALRDEQSHQLRVRSQPSSASSGETEGYSSRIESLEDALHRARCQVSASSATTLQEKKYQGRQIVTNAGTNNYSRAIFLAAPSTGHIASTRTQLRKRGKSSIAALRVQLDGANATSTSFCGGVGKVSQLAANLKAVKSEKGSIVEGARFSTSAPNSGDQTKAPSLEAASHNRVEDTQPDCPTRPKCPNQTGRMLAAALPKGVSGDAHADHGDAISALHASFAAAQAAHASEIGGLRSALAAARAASVTTNRDTVESNLYTKINSAKEQDGMVEALKLQLKALTSAHGREMQRLKKDIQAEVSAGMRRGMSEDDSKTMIEMLRNQLEAAGLKPIDKVKVSF